MRILVLSDSHIPRVTQDLPAKIYEEINRSDMVIHAGDFIDEETLDRLKNTGKRSTQYTATWILPS